MAILINQRDCDTQRLGTGVNDCIISLDSQPYGYFLVETSWSADIAADTINAQYVTDRVQDGSWIPFVNKINFTDNSEETVFETFDSGVKGRVRDGFPEYAFAFDKGLYFHKATHSYKTFQSYNIVFILEDSTLLLAESVDGLTLMGFSAGYVDAATFAFETGSTVPKTTTAFQLIDADQFNSRSQAITGNVSGIDRNNIDGQLDVVLTLQEPTALDTDLIFSAVLANNEAIQADFFLPTDLRVVGTTGTILTLVFDSGTNLYTMGLSAGVASTENIYVQIWDALFVPDPVPAVVVAGEVYAGQSNTVIVP